MEGSLASLDSSDRTSISDGGSNKEETEKLERVLVGDLVNLPSLSSRIVRIFTSSTFTGKIKSRNIFYYLLAFLTALYMCRLAFGIFNSVMYV